MVRLTYIGERGKLWINDQTLLSTAGNFTARAWLVGWLVVLHNSYHIVRTVVEKWCERLSEEQTTGTHNRLNWS